MEEGLFMEVQSHLRHGSEQLDHDIAENVELISFSSVYPSVLGVLESLAPGEVSLEENPETLTQLAGSVFLSLAESHPDFDQLRYIDETGQEIVRVNVDDGIISLAPQDELQQKMDRYYFHETMRLNPGDAYVSTLDLNEELGAVEVPHLPTIRFAAPVFDLVDKSRRGIVVVNLNATSLLHGVSEAHVGESYLVDQDGNYLLNPDHNKTFSNQLGTGFNYFFDHPEAVKELQGQISAQVHDEEDRELRSSSKIFYNPSDPEKYWILIYVVGEDELFAPVNYLLFLAGLITASAVLIVVLLSFFLARSITGPLLSLISSSRQIAAGNYDQKIETKRKDEIGKLADSFNVMAGNVKKAYGEVSQEKDKIQTLLESIGDGVVAIDRSWNIILWNQGASELTGYTAKEVKGKPFREIVKFVRERDRKESINFIEHAMVTGETGYLENHTVLVKKDGNEIPVGDSAAPIRDPKGKIVGAIVVFRDVSKQRESQRLKSDFAYASHQLRTPVSKALWNVENALDQEDRPEIKESIKLAYNSLESTAKLVSKLVAVSEIDQGTKVSKPKKIKIGDLVEGITKKVKAQAKEQGVHLSVESTPVTVNTDPSLLETAIFEVLENAITYSREGGNVTLKISESSKGALIEIEDSGLGIPEKEQALIFTKFFRGSNIDTTETVGAGLGLFMASEYVKLLGGKLWFDSKENKGTTFSILIPFDSSD